MCLCSQLISLNIQATICLTDVLFFCSCISQEEIQQIRNHVFAEIIKLNAPVPWTCILDVI